MCKTRQLAWKRPEEDSLEREGPSPPPRVEVKRERPLCDFWASRGAFVCFCVMIVLSFELNFAFDVRIFPYGRLALGSGGAFLCAAATRTCSHDASVANP